MASLLKSSLNGLSGSSSEAVAPPSILRVEQTESVGPHGDLIRAAEVRVRRKSTRHPITRRAQGQVAVGTSFGQWSEMMEKRLHRRSFHT